jgi:hypothetical protein
MFTPLF